MDEDVQIVEPERESNEVFVSFNRAGLVRRKRIRHDPSQDPSSQY